MNTDFKIHFDGQRRQIDASVLIYNLIHIFSIIQELNGELNTNKKIDMKIRALEKSGFLSDDERISTIAAKLNIVKVSFDHKLKWEFIFKGNKISAKSDDPVFQERIDKGESYAKGDVLEVELAIKQKYEYEPEVNY
jgi:hypothetical protein